MNKRNNLEKYVRRQPPNAVTKTFGAGLFGGEGNLAVCPIGDDPGSDGPKT